MHAWAETALERKVWHELKLHDNTMDSVGVHTLGSAAAQGGQDTSSEHANGSTFTGWDSGVQASQDAPCQSQS